LCNDSDEYRYYIKIRPDDKIKNLESIEALKLEDGEKKEG